MFTVNLIGKRIIVMVFYNGFHFSTTKLKLDICKETEVHIPDCKT